MAEDYWIKSMKFTQAVPAPSNLYTHPPGYSVFLPARSVQTSAGTIALGSSSLWVEAPPTQVMTEEAVLSSRHQLPAHYVRDLIIESATRATTIEPGTHFRVLEDCGQIIPNREIVGSRTVIEFTGCLHRYDAVCFDPDTGLLVRLQGEPRLIDPEEYRPAIPAEFVHLCNLYVWPGGVDVIDVGEWQSYVRHGRELEHAQLQMYCQSAIEAVLTAATQGKSIKIGGYGDSITAMGSRPPNLHLAPNGPTRDHIAYFSRFPTETRHKLRKGNPGRHVRAGWCWALAQAFERRGIAVEYRNWGIPGTTAGSEVKIDPEGSQFYDGNHPERLRHLLADKCDLVVVGFGTNDIGDPQIYFNMRRLIESIHGSGARCIVVNAPALNPVTSVRPYNEWLQTNLEICRAANDANAAYVPLQELYAIGNEGALGLSRRSYAAGNALNHPGISELKGIGEFLVGLVL